MPTSSNYSKDCPSTLEESLEALQSTWNIEAARELPDWDVDEAMESILADETGDNGVGDRCQVEEATSGRPHRKMRRRRALTVFRCRVGIGIDNLRLNSASFIVMMSVISISAMWSNPLLGTICFGISALVATRATYAGLRHQFTWWRLRRTVPSLFARSPDAGGEGSDTPLFEEVGRYATPKVLEELRENLEILRAQHHWRVVHLDRRVFKEQLVAAADKEIIADAELEEQPEMDDTISESRDASAALRTAGKHRQPQDFPYLLRDEEREAS